MTELQAMALKALLDAAASIERAYLSDGRIAGPLIDELSRRSDDVYAMFDGELPE